MEKEEQSQDILNKEETKRSDDYQQERKAVVNNDIETEKDAKKEYQSGELMLSVIQKEYVYESDRAKSLESRTGIFLAFSGVLLAFFSSNLKLPNLNTIEITNALESLPFILIWQLAILNFMALFGAIIHFIFVVSVQTYKRLSFNGFNQKNATCMKEQVAVSIMKEYQLIVTHNCK